MERAINALVGLVKCPLVCCLDKDNYPEKSVAGNCEHHKSEEISKASEGDLGGAFTSLLPQGLCTSNAFIWNICPSAVEMTGSLFIENCMCFLFRDVVMDHPT